MSSPLSYWQRNDATWMAKRKAFPFAFFVSGNLIINPVLQGLRSIPFHPFFRFLRGFYTMAKYQNRNYKTIIN